MKIMTIFGTRPEIIRLSLVMKVLDQHCEHISVHTGQNYDYELNEIFFTDLEIRRPDHFLNAAGENAAETIGLVISKVDGLLKTEQPAQSTAHGGEHAVGQADGITFDTEMLQVDLSGGSLPGGVMIRESPTLASLGSTKLTDQGGGNFRIDSFFDVFTELPPD